MLTPFKIVSESLMICFKQVSQNGTIDFYLLIMQLISIESVYLAVKDDFQNMYFPPLG